MNNLKSKRILTENCKQLGIGNFVKSGIGAWLKLTQQKIAVDNKERLEDYKRI